MEGEHLLLDGVPDPLDLTHASEGLEKRTLLFQRPLVDPDHGGVADAALGEVDDAQERHLIHRVGDHPEVGDGVLHLLALEELGAADQHVRDVLETELLLEGAALGVGAVEDGEVAVGDIRLEALQLDPLDHRGRLLLVVLHDAEVDERPVPRRRPEPFLLAHLVVADHAVGGVQDVAGRAVVLLQLDGPATSWTPPTA